MNVLASALMDHIQQNWVAISAAGGVLFVAVVSCMPPDPPASIRDYWHWVRESLQTAIPAARRNHTDPPPNPQPPAEPAQPKE